jgi:caffeoyl-CoA O-methyltransferase
LPKEANVDLAFIDADKSSYLDYYEELVTRVRPGGVLLVDNVLWSRRVIDAAITDDDTTAIRTFNDRIAADDRVDTVMLPIGDGLTIAYKK